MKLKPPTGASEQAAYDQGELQSLEQIEVYALSINSDRLQSKSENVRATDDQSEFQSLK